MHDKPEKKAVTHVITDLADGGAQSSLFVMCQHEQNCKHRVISLSGMGKYGSLLSEIGAEVYCLDMPRGRVTAKGFRKLVQLLRYEHSDVVQCWMYHANLLTSLAGLVARQTNIVWGIHHTTLDRETTRLSTLVVAKIAGYLSYLLPSAVICCAEASRETHKRFGYDTKKMRVIPNGYDLEKFYPNHQSGSHFRKNLGLPEESSVIGFVARLNPQKDHNNLLEAVAHLKRKGVAVRCLLAGTGLEPKSSPLIEAIKELDLNDSIILLGPVDDVPALMNALDIHVMSSSYGEAFPNVLSEAMACGTPCVATDVGDAAFIIGQTGLVVSPRKPTELAAAIESLLNSKPSDKWATLKARARERVTENFSIEKICERHREIWFDETPQ